MVRVDFKAIFGISFSKNLDIFAISKAIQTAIPYVEQHAPDLFKFLNTVLKTIDHLMVINELIQNTGEDVQKLEKQVKEVEEKVKEANSILTQQNQAITSSIGTTGGDLPPFPTAITVLTPLSVSLTTAEKFLEEIKQKLENKREYLGNLSQQYKDGLDELTSSIEEKVKNSSLAEKIDTTLPQYIYR